jgi:pimeloyl-ACP methyl ester carboxylesterase
MTKRSATHLNGDALAGAVANQDERIWMPQAVVPSGIVLEYETFGDPTDEAILLIAGFGAQMISWDAGFCAGLARRGRFVIRFDNRDTGLSTTFDQHPVDLLELVGAASIGDLETVRSLAAYVLADLADDAAGLAHALGLDQVHVVGASMGGMVAQLVAIRHPDLVATLTSMMSSTGSPDVGQSTPEAFAALMKPTTLDDRDRYIADSVASSRVWSSKRYFDEATAAALAAASYDRGLCPGGTTRQLAALLATGSLESDLARLRLPVLVIHGTDDTLITLSGGERTAEVIPGAELTVLTDMGHDRPEPLWPTLWNTIETHTAGVRD